MDSGVAPITISIGLLWHSVNSGNLGVGALTVSNIALARRAAAAAGLEPRFHILGFVDPAVPHYVSGPDIDDLAINTRAMLPGGTYWRTLADLDCVLDIGGGDSFADIYGLKRFGFLWLSKIMAIARRVPLGLSPQTIGPFNRQPQTFLAAHAMQRAAFVMARDPLSLDVARRMAPETPVSQAVDVAFALPFESRQKANATVVEVGLNVSGLLFNGGYSGANEFGMQVDYAAYTRRLIAALLERPNVSVKLICHVNSDVLPQDDDGRVADRLATEFPEAERVPNFTSPSAAKSYISGLDFLVAGRMHACIAAYSSGVAVVPVAYSRKFIGLFEGLLGYPHIVPVTGLDTDTALKFTLDSFDDREKLRADLAHSRGEIDALLDNYCAELTDLFLKAIKKNVDERALVDAELEKS
ncbi:polysaccharide pyruvyl transferase family protein [Phenylobacterium sp.]|uniref:polysaccharide pyruvyl transferase family protein n=1 Tax=Phenylobacterium sp. TaxID=1871053 RepID=UPI002CD23181|nr:polysaccharide pyruvyl transferase family protein [Phenylobacterium sp.]HLZ75497.1 polysaccharide pyruvyl transferase family protein [Phenylobacterium sp.]